MSLSHLSPPPTTVPRLSLLDAAGAVQSLDVHRAVRRVFYVVSLSHLSSPTTAPRLSLLDAAGAAQSLDVHRAVRRVLGWPSSPAEDISAQERYLVALSAGSHPPRELVTGQVASCQGRAAETFRCQTMVSTCRVKGRFLCQRSCVARCLTNVPNLR